MQQWQSILGWTLLQIMMSRGEGEVRHFQIRRFSSILHNHQYNKEPGLIGKL